MPPQAPSAKTASPPPTPPTSNVAMAQKPSDSGAETAELPTTTKDRRRLQAAPHPAIVARFRSADARKSHRCLRRARALRPTRHPWPALRNSRVNRNHRWRAAIGVGQSIGRSEWREEAASSGSPSTPPPGDSMPRRSLDVAQSSSSQRMRLKVDQWAGSFSGQQRNKLEMAIAPKLEALDKELAKAQRTAQGVLDAVAAEGEWRGTHDRDVTSAEQATVRGQTIIGDLQKHTKDTPYAFIGLQVADIGLAHVDPARTGFWTALQSDGDERVTVCPRCLAAPGPGPRNCSPSCAANSSERSRSFNSPSRSSGSRRCIRCMSRIRWPCCRRSPTTRPATAASRSNSNSTDEYLKRLQEVMKMREDVAGGAGANPGRRSRGCCDG